MKLLLTSLMIISLLAPVGCSENISKKGNMPNLSTAQSSQEGIKIEGLYNDGSNSFKEMKNKSTVVGLFEVIKVEQVSEFAVAATVQSLKIWKGKAPERIVIPQIGQVEDGEVLDEGKSYVLFLAPDAPGKMHILGGIEGLFTVKNSKAYTHRWSSELGASIELDAFEGKVSNED